MDHKPAVTINIAMENGVDEKYIHWIQYGLEEESIPYKIMSSDLKDARELSNFAANNSKLGIGIGIDCRGYSCLTSDNFRMGDYLFYAQRNDESELRKLGANSARLLKRYPFK